VAAVVVPALSERMELPRDTLMEVVVLVGQERLPQ
jgi:hypothetical protein